jgi:hypothetical protein
MDKPRDPMMLTGACDGCHETAAFEDHLAGMTVRCKRCGQGWVRVPPTPGPTASVYAVAATGSTTAVNTAATDEPPMTLNATTSIIDPSVPAPLTDGPAADGALVAGMKRGRESFRPTGPKRLPTPFFVLPWTERAALELLQGEAEKLIEKGPATP